MRRCHQYLIVDSSQPENAFGQFTAEILRAEGLFGFETIDVATTPWPDLGPDDLVVWSRSFARRAQVDRLLTAVRAGTRLVALQPQWSFAKALGWEPRMRVLHPGRIRIQPGYPGDGTPIQAHAPIALYAPPADASEIEIVAGATDDAGNDTGDAAAARQRLGAGEVALLFYDLPKAVARIRFGDPDLASLLNSATWEWLHSCDLFDGHVDPDLIHLPQADFHGQLLAKLLTDISPYPLPRLWYYERPEHLSAAVFSSDDDWSTVEQFSAVATAVEARGGRVTFYLVEDTALSPEAVTAYRERGHTFGPHVNFALANEEPYFGFLEQVGRERESFAARFGPQSLSLQCHCAPWQGYVSVVPELLKHGFRMLFSHLTPPQWLNGFICGSGRPMRHADADGHVHDCWQQPLITFDDLTLVDRISTDCESLLEEFATVLDGCERHHTAVGMASHPISFGEYSQPFIEGCLDLLAARRMPIYSGDDWCLFQDRRDTVRVDHRFANDGSLVLRLRHEPGPLTLMIPSDDETAPAIHVDGGDATGLLQPRLGQSYRLVPLTGDGDETTVRIGNES